MRASARLLRDMKPRAVVTCARGSSDHAATFAKYLIEIARRRPHLLGRAVGQLALRRAAGSARRAVPRDLAVGQEPRSARVAWKHAKRGGAFVLALCNSTDSPLARLADHLDAAARRRRDERRGDQVLHRLAERDRASGRELDARISTLLDALLQRAGPARAGVGARLERRRAGAAATRRTCIVIGRGYGLGVAQEAALKLKETCGLHAEAFSAAEVQHGPMALVRPGFPVLMLSQNDETRAGIADAGARLRRARRRGPDRGRPDRARAVAADVAAASGRSSRC